MIQLVVQHQRDSIGRILLKIEVIGITASGSYSLLTQPTRRGRRSQALVNRGVTGTIMSQNNQSVSDNATAISSTTTPSLLGMLRNLEVGFTEMSWNWNNYNLEEALPKILKFLLERHSNKGLVYDELYQQLQRTGVLCACTMQGRRFFIFTKTPDGTATLTANFGREGSFNLAEDMVNMFSKFPYATRWESENEEVIRNECHFQGNRWLDICDLKWLVAEAPRLSELLGSDQAIVCPECSSLHYSQNAGVEGAICNDCHERMCNDSVPIDDEFVKAFAIPEYDPFASEEGAEDVV
jgi:hypothetical protein